jgi:hypothetical protein
MVFPLLCRGQNNRNPNPAIVEVRFTAQRNSQRRIEIDGTVRNTGKQQLRKLTLVYLFVSPEGHIVAKREAAVENPPVDPGDEVEFGLETPDVPRAVELRVAAERGGIQIEVQGGPFPIE